MHPYLLPTLEFGPLIMRRLLHRIPETRWDEPGPDERFSPREIIAHLADWEPILLGRMKTGLATPGAAIEAYDEVQWARDHNYGSTNPWQQVDLYIERRRETAEYLRSLDGDDWEKTVTHPERGMLTTYDQANLLLGHDLYHIEQLSAYMEDKTAATW
jgi:hypothetical protein